MRKELNWYALHVKTGYERDVALSAMSGEVVTLLPVERYIRRTAKGEREHERVLLPGYVFAGCLMTPSIWQELRHTKGVLRILGEPFEPIRPEEMTNLMALYWHGVNGTKVRRQDGVTRVIEGALMEVPHKITCADARQGVITVMMDLPGGRREVTMHAQFIAEQDEEAGMESGGLRIPHAGNSEKRRQAVP